MKGKWMAERPAERGRPLWGYCRVRAEAICRLWVAYREGKLTRQDVQIWFGVHELLMRRCTFQPGRKPSFSERELEPLTGMRAPTIRASIRRLEARGFLSWSKHEPIVQDGPEAILGGLIGLAAMLSAVTNHRRTLPIPRHTILLLARTRRPVIFATVLGHLFRGMYYRSQECVSWGTCKASWIAATFGVDVRNVKAARGELERSGWLRPLDSHHWHRQRYGGSFVIPLAWAGSRLRPPRVSSPPKGSSASKSPPPESYRNLPSGIKNQKREHARVPGVQEQKAKREGEPRLLHVVPVDLIDPQRTAELFRQALQARLVNDDPLSRLQFFAAAQRAKRLGSNPGGFFVTILKKRLWRNIANCDEERARSELARMPDFFYAGNTRLKPQARSYVQPMREPCGEGESMDQATIRQLIRRSLASVGAASNEGSP
jgi:hypothetical protein